MGNYSHDSQTFLAYYESTRSSNPSDEVFWKFVQRKAPEMKKTLLLIFSLWITAVVIACQPANQSTDNSMLQPGDEIDGMVITTGAAKAPPLGAFCSVAQDDEHVMKADCRIPPQLSEVAIGHIFHIAEIPINLDWSKFTWKLTVDEQPVDLARFGNYDLAMPTRSTSPSPIRETFEIFTAWDVVLTHLKPGRHTVQGLANSETDTYTWIVSLVIEAPHTSNFGSSS
jgi:hypothetical protein